MKLGILSLSLLTAGCLSIASAKETVVINPDKVYQSIDGFGASDAWSIRFVGEMPKATQNAVADLLFSSDTDTNRNPNGIGLSIWRFNIGAGSVEQGDSSQINFGTRTDCFLNPDGTYDWNKQAGQRRFLQLAKERGVPYLLGFLNSPPVYFTQNGLATNTGRGGTYNLQPDKHDDFARFMADSVTDPYGLMLSAYRNADGSIVLVAINYSDQTKDFILQLPDKKMTLRQSYTTSDLDGENLAFRKQNLKSGMTVRIPAKAIVTFTE